ncbi:MAG: VWA domain-containing protein [Deltaproteobacteria bacterium]|nr:VWA domain-containing protein [Deltaproteobacteria bacterium]
MRAYGGGDFPTQQQLKFSGFMELAVDPPLHKAVIMKPTALLAPVFALACTGQLGPANSGDDPGDESSGVDAAPEPADIAPGCPSLRSEVEAQVATIMLLVDRSGTMNRDFAGTDRWDAIYDTLMDSQDGLVKRLENQVQFGLTLYTGSDDIPTCPILNQVAPSMGNFQAINSEFSSQSPLEDTPTGESLDAISAYLAALPDTGPKAIVVATDGEPDTCADPDPDGQPAALNMAVEAASRAHGLGIETFIISVGDEVSDSHLQAMANAGQGLAPSGPQDATFYRALSPVQLEDAFDGIVAGVRGCSFELDEPADDASTGSVTLDGSPLALGSEWQLKDPSTIELLGSACDQVLDGGEHTVQAVFDCTEDGPIVR